MQLRNFSIVSKKENNLNNSYCYCQEMLRQDMDYNKHNCSTQIQQFCRINSNNQEHIYKIYILCYINDIFGPYHFPTFPKDKCIHMKNQIPINMINKIHSFYKLNSCKKFQNKLYILNRNIHIYHLQKYHHSQKDNLRHMLFQIVYKVYPAHNNCIDYLSFQNTMYNKCGIVKLEV